MSRENTSKCCPNCFTWHGPDSPCDGTNPEIAKLRLENARLAAMVESLRDTVGYISVATDHQNKKNEGPTCHICKRVEDALDQSPSAALAEFLNPLQASLLECRNRLAAHDGCSRYQIGDSCIIERADKELSRLSAIGGAK